MILEACDQRILAALRCVDAVTGVPLIDPVQVSAAGEADQKPPRALCDSGSSRLPGIKRLHRHVQ